MSLRKNFVYVLVVFVLVLVVFTSNKIMKEREFKSHLYFVFKSDNKHWPNSDQKFYYTNLTNKSLRKSFKIPDLIVEDDMFGILQRIWFLGKDRLVYFSYKPYSDVRSLAIYDINNEKEMVVGKFGFVSKINFIHEKEKHHAALLFGGSTVNSLSMREAHFYDPQTKQLNPQSIEGINSEEESYKSMCVLLNAASQSIESMPIDIYAYSSAGWGKDSQLYVAGFKGASSTLYNELFVDRDMELLSVDVLRKTVQKVLEVGKIKAGPIAVSPSTDKIVFKDGRLLKGLLSAPSWERLELGKEFDEYSPVSWSQDEKVSVWTTDNIRLLDRSRFYGIKLVDMEDKKVVHTVANAVFITCIRAKGQDLILYAKCLTSSIGMFREDSKFELRCMDAKGEKDFKVISNFDLSRFVACYYE